MRSGAGARPPGEVLTATVVGLTHEGEGVVREGKTVFVAGALPGERIRYTLARRHRQHDEGRLLEVLEPSAARVSPRCDHFGTCGGCALQHLDPAAQLAAKQRELADSLVRVARTEPRRWLEPLAGPVWHYRRRARLGAKYVLRKGRVVVGFRERLAPYVAALADCEVLAAPVGSLLQPLGELIGCLSIRTRLPQIEVAVAENAVALVLRTLDPASAEDLQRLREFARQHAVRLYLQPGGPETVAPLDPLAEPLRYTLPDFGLTLEFLPTDFVQVNAAVNAALVTRALELLDAGPEARVLDLFCGLGNFTLAVARRAREVVGVEGEEGLVARARHNARLNGLDNTAFHTADLSRAPEPASPWLRGGFSHVLLDPPRVGASEILQSVAGLRPGRILYISCHPGSLARDLGVLVHQHGFDLLAAGVVDMFPHTAHVESMALLAPGKGA